MAPGVTALTQRSAGESWHFNGGSRTLDVPHHARGARVARQHLAAQLNEQVSPSLLSDVVTVVAELLGNAVQHARPLPGGVMRLAWRLGHRYVDGAPADGVLVRVMVTDGGAATPPHLRAAAPDAVDGRGLAIVAALALSWGVEPEGSGQCVWAELGTVAR